MKNRKREVIAPANAPAAIGPYSPAIRIADLIYTSGSLGMDPQSGELVPGGIEQETRQALLNINTILEAGGSSLGQIVKTTVFLQNLEEFPQMNAVYAGFFNDRPPARTTVEVAALPKGAAIEIEAVAIVSDEGSDE
ncbi:MAG: reactive intermediate/imine deaminase [Chloroflexi bacterium]|nr:reactive intermediate/imine deaminase [Chloroflexota bacterium]